jgi:S-DNA-T family DNA segregation ATPase FtsK/SpoIIIE
MAAPKKPAKKAPVAAPPPPATVAPHPVAPRRQARLAIGTLLLLAGAYALLSIVSYWFTWKTDQDLVVGTQSAKDFLLHDNSVAANWGGRLGASLSHSLVFRGVGIAAAAIALWIGAAGLHFIYGKRALPLMRYLRWLSLMLLVTAPILAYMAPDSSFPWGGAWGSRAVDFLNGFLGVAGTGLVLAATAAFVVFVVFALDISPMLRRARRTARAAYNAVLPTPTEVSDDEEAGQESPEEPEEPAQKPAKRQKETVVATPPFILDDKPLPVDADPAPLSASSNSAGEARPISGFQEGGMNGKAWDVPVTTTAAATKAPSAVMLQNGSDTDLLEDEEEEIEEDEMDGESLRTEAGDPDFSFEVVTTEEKPAAVTVKHGGHISVESGEAYAPELDLPDYRFPTLDLLPDRAQETIALDKDELEKNKNQIIQTLKSFGIEIQRISATVGPTVTLYEIVPAEGVRISKIRNLEDDIALNLAALGIRIIAPIPGKGTIGIEVPNANKQIVSMRALLASEKFVNSKMSLPIALGKTISNENYIVDLATMPHLLMAGATGQGKSVGINAILVSLLYKKHPSQLKFVMVDPKKVELSIYRTIEKHFLAKLPNEEEAIITDTKKVIYTLNALCIEMDNRYELLKEAGARNIKEYNDKFIARRLNPERGHKYLPFIVLVVDEFADLIMTAGKEVEMPIARLAQLARAVGIHLIIATQRPSVNVITGTIKANFPGRAAFKVSAKVDSRTILDAGGAEQLIGRGDMLVSAGSELLRVQCAFVDTPEVERIVDFIGSQRGYPHAFELPEYEGEDGDSGKDIVDLTNRDKLFDDCARVVVQLQSGSTSMLQRRFNLGYNRAGRIMDQLEAAGIVGPAMGSKPRDVLYHAEMELEQFLQTLG